MSLMKQSKTPATITPGKPTKIPILISYAYLRTKSQEEVGAGFMNNPKVEVLIDSGAFSAFNAGKEIGLKEYLTFLDKYKDKIVGYLALDKIQDPIQTEINLQIMLKEGFKPIPVHIFGDDEARLNELYGLSDWVALAGLRRPHRWLAPKPYVKKKMEWARGRKVHWLGYTSSQMIRAFRPYSCDCSSFAQGDMYGRCSLYAGNGKMYVVGRNKKHLLQDTLAVKKVLDGMGYSMAEFMNDDNWRKHKDRPFMISYINTYSYMKYAHQLEQQFGTKLYLAMEPQKRYLRSVEHWIPKILP